MKIPYFPGCTLKTTAKNFETSALAVAGFLEIDLVELPRWNCCGTVASLTSDDLMHHLAPIRDLVRVEEMIEDSMTKEECRLVALCSMCFHVLKRSHLRVMENHEELEKITSLTATDDQGKVKLEWDEIDNDQFGHYIIYRNDVGPIATISSVSTTTYTDIYVNKDGEYTYMVSAANKVGTEGEKSDPVIVKVTSGATGIKKPDVIDLSSQVTPLKTIDTDGSFSELIQIGSDDVYTLTIEVVDNANNKVFETNFVLCYKIILIFDTFFDIRLESFFYISQMSY